MIFYLIRCFNHPFHLTFTMDTITMRGKLARELHKVSRKNFPRRHVELKGLEDLYQADLVDMIKFSKFNKGFKYIMTIINCFSKFALAIPLKSKSKSEVSTALKPVFERYKMKNFQTDQGLEFFNSDVKTLVRKFNINHYFTYSEKKASICERFNRTLKSKMWRYFSEKGNYKWIDILPTLVNNYNRTFHSTIGMKPYEVNKSNENMVLKNILKNRRPIKKVNIKFKVGDRVRVSRFKREFAKGYWPQWSNEIYSVCKVQLTSPVTYLLKDGKGEILKGGFYQQELSKTQLGDIYLVEKVLRKKGEKLFVRWLGFDKSHDSWINKADLVQ